MISRVNLDKPLVTIPFGELFIFYLVCYLFIWLECLSNLLEMLLDEDRALLSGEQGLPWSIRPL